MRHGFTKSAAMILHTISSWRMGTNRCQQQFTSC